MITESTFGYDVRGSQIRASLLRSPIFCFHDPARPRPNVRYQYVDQGGHDYRVWLKLHAGGWRTAGLPRLAEELVCPVSALPEPPHEGELPAEASFLEVGPEPVACTVLKRAEMSFEDAVVRFYETTGEPGPAWVRSEHFGWRWEGEVGACEIKTLRVTRAGAFIETNMLEELPSEVEDEQE
jgi:alpha-mannosidase